ncbi:lycopene cyclase domain-containing protein [Salinimicrobium oceani]|uniref:Lycopene cyclase domain-containing protein n=1 Tax=Salinimicrobium oceani TaxID=2722702 RepID=A0ABX1CX32_9FLAO|nr:lycopene cyclase domain-containing protein [Salinimicrobium oceani]NJW52827.1 lycopene cyclase domain-containing protein [Salinimicrobium oceani]
MLRNALGANEVFQGAKIESLMQYTYLLVNFFTIIIPFLFSFHPKLKFHRTWSSFFPAVFITGFIFVLWDMYFTQQGVWGFNHRYLTGLEIGNLPVEEVLFFFCIPYACVFTFHCLDLFMRETGAPKMQKFITLFLVAGLVIFGTINYDRSYTVTTFLSFSLLLLYAEFFLKINWLLRFYLIYTVLLIPFFLVNGVLTGSWIEEEVVWYNTTEFMNFRIGTIPVEDAFYGAELILLNLLIYKALLRYKRQEDSRAYKASAT